MTTANKSGEWTTSFGGSGAFEDEISSAIEVDAKWIASAHRRDIVFPNLAGWLPPLWGAKNDWIYLRRPQGIWKARVPEGFDKRDDLSIRIYQETRKRFWRRSIVGGMAIGRSIASQPGWVQGNATGHVIDAGCMDAKKAAFALAEGVNADVIETGWGALIFGAPTKIIVHGGDCFCKAPQFWMEDGWLMASDVDNGKVVGFSLTGFDVYGECLRRGHLWMEFGSKWLPKFRVKVILSR